MYNILVTPLPSKAISIHYIPLVQHVSNFIQIVYFSLEMLSLPKTSLIFKYKFQFKVKVLNY